MRGEQLEKTTWPNKLEYHLNLFNQALGLCSFWRFPYLAFRNNGAPFLYIFLLVYIFIGVPLVFLEMSWGQYSNLAPPQAYGIVPIMQGIGICMLFLSAVVVVYFGVVSYYFLLTITTSFAQPLPWTTCTNTWNDAKCQENLHPQCINEDAEGFDFHKEDFTYGITINGTFTKMKLCNYTSDHTQTAPALQYCETVLQTYTAVCQNFDDIPNQMLQSNVILVPVATLGIYVSIRVIIALFGLASHVRFTGKVAYVLCPIPFAISVMLLVRCLTLDGAAIGLRYLFVPENVQDFASPRVWKDAVSQVFLCLLITWGGLHTWSSYQRFFNKIQLDGPILLTIQPFVAFLSTIAVFSVIGNLSYQLDVSPDQAMRSVAAPLTPIAAYMHAIMQMWGEPLPWSIVIFSSMYLLSTPNMFPGMECLLTSISDSFWMFRATALRIVSVITLILVTLAIYYGIPCLIEGTGLQMIEIVDTFALPVCLMLLAIPQALIITYGFGMKLLRANIKAMTNKSCLKGFVWLVFWGGITPLITACCLGFVLFGIFVNGIVSMTTNVPNDQSVMSQSDGWTRIASFVLIGIILLTLLITAIVKVVKIEGTNFIEKLQNSLQPVTDGRASGVSMSPVSNGNRAARTNGDLFLVNYSGHHDTNEILIDEDRVTTV